MPLNHATRPISPPITATPQSGVASRRASMNPAGSGSPGRWGSRARGKVGEGVPQLRVATSTGRSIAMRRSSRADSGLALRRKKSSAGCSLSQASAVAGKRISGMAKPLASRAQSKGTLGAISVKSCRVYCS